MIRNIPITSVLGFALVVGATGCGSASGTNSNTVRETERRNEANPNVVNGPDANRENRAGQAINGDARGTPNTAPPPVAPGDARGARPQRNGGPGGSR